MVQNLNENYYETSDLIICVVLQYFKHELIDVNKTNPRRCIFRIQRKKNTDKILEEFYQGDLLVEPKLFSSIQKNTKGRIYN